MMKVSLSLTEVRCRATSVAKNGKKNKETRLKLNKCITTEHLYKITTRKAKKHKKIKNDKNYKTTQKQQEDVKKEI